MKTVVINPEDSSTWFLNRVYENIKDLTNVIKKALAFEIDWLTFKATNYLSIGSALSERIDVLRKRIE